MRTTNQSSFGGADSAVQPKSEIKTKPKKPSFEVSGGCFGNGFAMPPMVIIREK